MLSWTGASKQCQKISSSKSGDLASAPDEQTNYFLSLLTHKRGLLGGFKNDEGDWSWSDGSAWQYELWHEGQPSDRSCVALSKIINTIFILDAGMEMKTF